MSDCLVKANVVAIRKHIMALEALLGLVPTKSMQQREEDRIKEKERRDKEREERRARKERAKINEIIEVLKEHGPMTLNKLVGRMTIKRQNAYNYIMNNPDKFSRAEGKTPRLVSLVE